MVDALKERISKFVYWLNEKENRTKFIIALTTVISLPIMIAFVVNYFSTCKELKFRTQYNDKFGDCYCEVSMSSSGLTSYFKNNGFLQTTQTSLFSFWETRPDVIYTDYINVVVTEPKLQTYISSLGIPYPYPPAPLISVELKIPLSNFDKQLNALKIVPLVINTSHPFAISSNFNTSYGDYSCGIMHEECYTNSSTLMYYQASDGYCFYSGGVVTPEDQLQILCLENDCNALIAFIVDLQSAIVKDIETSMFSTTPAKYCIPSYCLKSNCYGNNLFQVVLLCISIPSTVYTIMKFLNLVLYKFLFKQESKKKTKHNIENKKELNDIIV